MSVHGLAFALAAHFIAGGGAGDASSAVSDGVQDLSLAVKVAALHPPTAREDAQRAAAKPDVIRKALPARLLRVFAAGHTDFALPPPESQPALPEPSVPGKSTPAEPTKTVATGDDPPSKKAAARSVTKRAGGSSKGGTGNSAGSGAGAGTGVASAPRPLLTRVPVYPYAAKKRGEQGQVLVRVRVNEAGRVESSTLYRSCGHDDLDAAAVACVWKWSFAPGLAGGKAVASSAVVRVSFRLEG